MRVLVEETLPSTNVHSGNPVADRRAVPSTQTPFTPMLVQQSPHWSCTLELTPLGLHQLQSEHVGRSSDVLPSATSSYMIANRQIRWWRANPGDNRACSSQNASSMNRRPRSPLNHPSFLAYVFHWARPHLGTWKTRHHTQWPGRYRAQSRMKTILRKTMQSN